MSSENPDPTAGVRRLLALAAHEIQSPLSRIERLAKRLDASEPAERSQTAEAIRREAARARRLAADLIAWASIDETGPGEEAPLDRLIVEAASAIDPAEAAIVLASKGLTMLVPAALVRPLLTNLLENAVRHGGPTRPVPVAIRAVSDDGGMVLEVEDHGPGLPADRVADPFRPFAKGPGGGSGLGLAIVAAAAKKLGWRVSVENRPGEGVLFRFETGFAGN